MNIPPELMDVIECIKHNDNGLWEKVAALDGARFEIKFCCNSQRLQRVLLAQESWRIRTMKSMTRPVVGQMPGELAGIVDFCEDDAAFSNRVSVWSKGKFDIIFICAGGGLDKQPLLRDVP